MELTAMAVDILRRKVKAWEAAAYRGDSSDAEHDAALDLAEYVAGLIGFRIDTSDGESDG